MKHLKLHLIAFVTLCFLLAGSNAFADLTLPDSMTVIGEQAFMNDARLLGTVTIPEGVTTIGKEAFYCCTGIDTLVLPYSVEKIDSRAFAGCSGLTGTVVLPYGCEVAEDAFDGCEELTVEQVEITPEEYFSYEVIDDTYCRVTGYTGTATNVVIPEKLGVYYVREIGESAFESFSIIESITIPEGVTVINSNAFYGCSDLTSIVIPESVTFIDSGAFYGCSSLTSVTIPEGVTKIWANTFAYCGSLTSITIPEDVTIIYNGGFRGCSGLTSITIPDSVTKIYLDAFNGCSSLTSITIPEGVTTIGSRAFEGCSSLISITIPEGVTSIGDDVFHGCSNLTSITILEGVTTIGSGAFEGCSSLTSITIPEGVTSIGYGAFEDCSSLTSITIPEGVTTIGSGAFEGCSSLTNVYAKSIEGWLGISFYNWSGSRNNPMFYASNLYFDGVLAKDITIPEGVTSIGDYAFYNCSSLNSITIPESVTYIGDYAFYNCSSLTSLTVPEGVTSIGNYAFYGCSSLTNMTILEGVTHIGNAAFENCSSLTSITIPDSLTSIGGYVFDYCRSLTNVYAKSIEGWLSFLSNNDTLGSNPKIYAPNLYFDGVLAKDIIIPESVTCISRNAFYKCSSLTSVTIQAGVTSIDYDAFYKCTNLTSITIPDSVTSINDHAFDDCPSLTIYGERGSYAEEYALANNINFIAGEMPEPDYGDMTVSAAVTVLSHDGIPLTGINVEVLTVSDMAVAKRGITDAQGQVVFNGLQLRSYIFRCSDELFEFDDKYYTLTETESALTLTAKKPAFDYLAANADSYTAEAGGSTVSIAVSSSGDWRASTQDAWLTLGASEGVPGDVLSVTAAANDGLFRTGTVTLASGEWEISVYIQQAGAMSSRLPDPVITTPAEETVTVPYGDITITWEPVEGAGSYVISMRDLTTDDLILHHERLADQTQS